MTRAAAAAAEAAALRRFLPSFFETGFALGRSLMAVFCDTSDGADKWVDDEDVDDVVVVLVVVLFMLAMLPTVDVDALTLIAAN